MHSDPWSGHRRARGGPYARAAGVYRRHQAVGWHALRRPDSAVPSAPARRKNDALLDAVLRPCSGPHRGVSAILKENYWMHTDARVADADALRTP